MFSITGSKGVVLEKGLQRLEAFKFAIKEVNEKYNVLLNMQNIYNDLGDISTSLSSLHYAINNNTDMVIGPASSSLAESVAYFSNNFNLPVISYASSSTALSDSKKFQTLIRTISSDKEQIFAFVKMIEYFKWDIASIIGTDDLYGKTGVETFITNKPVNTTIACNQIISSKDFYKHIDYFGDCIIKNKSKVIIVFMNEVNSAKTITYMMEKLFTDDKTLFLASDSWASNEIIDYGISNVKGFDKKFIKNTIGVLQSPGDVSWFKKYFDNLNPLNNNNTYFKTFWENTFHCKENDTGCYTNNKFNIVPNTKISLVYDAVEAVGYSLSVLNNKNNQDYKVQDILSFIKNNTIQVKTGDLTIKGVDRQDIGFDYVLFNGDEWVKTGEYKNNDITIKTEDLYIPLQIYEKLIIEYSSVLSIIFIFLISVNILIALSVLLYFYTRSSDVQIKIYSLPFSILIMTGLIMIWLSLFLWLGEPSSLKCGFTRWFLYMGVTVVVSVLIAKGYRLFKIQNNNSLRGTKLSDKEIFFFVSVLCGLQLIILISGSFYGFDLVLNINNFNNLIRYENCNSNSISEWISIGYLSILVVAGSVIAFLTRNVHEKFNESKYTAFCMYSIFLNFCILIPIKLINFRDIDNGFYIQNLLNIVIIYFGSNVIFTVLFFPRVIVVYKRQHSSSTDITEQNKHENSSEESIPDIPQEMKQYI
jgi:hypothetical protein